MTKGDVEKIMKEAEEKDRLQAVQAKAEGKKPQMPVGMLLTAVTMGGRDTQAACCPVFALRLRSGQGRTLVDQLKGRMTAWDDSQ